MKRWWLWLIVAVIAAASSALAIRQVNRRRITANAAAIHIALIHYQQDLKPGLNRKEVRDYLRMHGIGFGERCCNAPNGAFPIVVRVGEEEVPWFCSSWPDYVSFEFMPTEAQGAPSRPLNSDVLKEVHLTSNGEGCL
jgi:hypothetical protein